MLQETCREGGRVVEEDLLMPSENAQEKRTREDRNSWEDLP